MMNNEFIIPVTDATRSIKLFPDESKRHSLPGVGLSTSLTPRVNFSPVCIIGTKRQQYLHSPQIPLDVLKEKAISMLTEAVQGGGVHIRDPVGGSVEYQFVPILKLIGTLLIMGVLTSEEVRLILLLIDPNVFGEAQEAEEVKGEEGAVAGEKEEVSRNEEKAVEAGEEETKESKAPVKGLLEKSLPESVKRQVSARTRTRRRSRLGSEFSPSASVRKLLVCQRSADASARTPSNVNERHVGPPTSPSSHCSPLVPTELLREL